LREPLSVHVGGPSSHEAGEGVSTDCDVATGGGEIADLPPVDGLREESGDHLDHCRFCGEAGLRRMRQLICAICGICGKISGKVFTTDSAE
jgi:hypothetical protein